MSKDLKEGFILAAVGILFFILTLSVIFPIVVLIFKAALYIFAFIFSILGLGVIVKTFKKTNFK